MKNDKSPLLVMETVKAAKAFIEAELAKYGTWEEWQASACRDLIRDPSNFGQLRQRGPGIETIHAFLGKQWSRYLIENTLSVIRQEETSARKKAEAYEAAQRAREEFSSSARGGSGEGKRFLIGRTFCF